MMGGCVCVEVYDPSVLKGYQEYAYKRGVFSRPVLKLSVRDGSVYYQGGRTGAGASVLERLFARG